MSTYKSRAFNKDILKIETDAVDEIGDGLIFYVDYKKMKITDDGYMFNEFELCGSKLSLSKIRKISRDLSHFYFCNFDESSEEIYIELCPEFNLDEIVTSMIQVCTAISTVINYERYWK